MKLNLALLLQRKHFIFPTYHFFSFIRRSKLITTGPWILVPPQVRLLDMSIEMDKHVGLVGIWTVGTKGDVLYRHGVTRECPQVREIAFMYVMVA